MDGGSGEYGLGGVGDSIGQIGHGLDYGTDQGPGQMPPQPVGLHDAPPQPAHTRKVKVHSRKQKLVAFVVGGVLMAAGFLALFGYQNSAHLDANVTAARSSTASQIVDVHLNGRLGWDAKNLDLRVVDGVTGQAVSLKTADGACGPLNETTAQVTAARNKEIIDLCTMVVRVPAGASGHSATVQMRIDGHRVQDAGSFTLG